MIGEHSHTTTKPGCTMDTMCWSALMLFVTVSLSSCAPGATAGALTNSSFEEWNDGLSGWHVDAAAKAQGTMEPDTQYARDGQYALHMRPNNVNTRGKNPYGAGQVVGVGNYHGMEAALTALLGAEGEATAVVGFHMLNAQGESIDGVQLRQDATANGMQEHSARLMIPDDGSAANAIVFCAVEGTAGSGYFDDLDLSFEVAAAKAAEPIIDKPASIVVHTQDVVRELPATLFGTNVEWIHNGNEIWNPNTNQARPEIVDLARDLDLSLVRFPGGGFSDVYHWRDGIGGPAERPTTPHYPGGPSSRHTFGTDEALAFAETIGANLLLTVNAGTGTPAEAADWVEYVNGPEGNSPRQERVDYWEIGNELYMKEDFSGATMTPQQYAARAHEFIAAMRAVDPRIKIAAIGGLNYGQYQVVDYPNWNPIVLEALAGDIDFLAVHNAYAPVITVGKGIEPERVYKAMLAAPVLIARNLQDIAAQIDAAAPEHASDIAIAVTEWGPLFHVLPSNEWVDHPKTLGAALYVADLIRVLMHAPKVQLATFFKLTEPGFLGWIGPKDNTYVAKAPYLAFQLYRKHFASSLVRTDTTSPVFDSQSTGMVAAVEDVPYLTACASIDRNAGRVFINVVNKHFSQPIETTISVEGIGTVTAGVARVLTGATLDAHTGTELPDIAGITWAKQRSFDDEVPFDSDRLETISVSEATLENPATSFTHTFRPHSMTNIELSFAP